MKCYYYYYYLFSGKKGEENKVPHPIDNFFSLMAATVKNFSPIDQHEVKTKGFAIVNDIEAKYLMQPPTYFTPSLQQSPAHFISSSQPSFTQHNTYE